MDEPESVAEVSELLGRFGDSAKIYAGGTELLLAMKEGLVDYERLINVKKLKCKDVTVENGALSMGALCTHRELETSRAINEKLPALAKLEHNVANVRVRQVGTIGGNLCFAEPHADPGTLLIALGAKMIAEKSSSQREIDAEKFFVDAFETALEPDEILTKIVVRVPSPAGRSAYLKFGYLERPSVGVGLAFNLNGQVSSMRIAVGCAGPAPRRVEEAEALLEGKSREEAERNLAQAGALAGRAAQAITDLHGSQDYKEHIVGVLLKRAFLSALS